MNETITENTKRLDIETLFIIAIFSIMQGIGIVSLIGAIAGVGFTEVGASCVFGMCFGLSGIIFGVLMFINTK